MKSNHTKPNQSKLNQKKTTKTQTPERNKIHGEIRDSSNTLLMSKSC